MLAINETKSRNEFLPEVIDKEKETSFLTKIVDYLARPLITLYNFALPRNPVTGNHEIHYITESEENSIGEKQYLSFIKNAELEEKYPLLEEIMQKLKEHSHRTLNYNVNVAVWPKNKFNAFSFPGGRVLICKSYFLKMIALIAHKPREGYIHPPTGELISYADLKLEDVLAVLLGHEMSHADARHHVRSLELRYSFLSLLGVITLGLLYKIFSAKGIKEIFYSVMAGLILDCLISLGIFLYLFFQNRLREFEADKYGIEMAWKAGYDPTASLLLNEIKHDSERTSDGGNSFLRKSFQKIQSLFDTHPSDSDRQLADFHTIKQLKIKAIN